MTFARAIFIVIIGCLARNTYGQKTKEFFLPSSLKEISGLAFLNKKTLVAINDGGNSNELFVLKKNGELIKRVEVVNAKNKDWEDLATDGTYLYIADIGNNANKRENLKIYKVNINEVLTKFEVKAELIEFNYSEQTQFPPDDENLEFDAEALACYKDTLWLFTKTNTKPWKGNARIYKVPTIPGRFTLSTDRLVHIGDDGWFQDAITAVDVYDDHFFISTYDRIVEYKFTSSQSIKLSTTFYEGATQKESIVVKDLNNVIVADERQDVLGGGKLYHIKLTRD